MTSSSVPRSSPMRGREAVDADRAAVELLDDGAAGACGRACRSPADRLRAYRAPRPPPPRRCARRRAPGRSRAPGAAAGWRCAACRASAARCAAPRRRRSRTPRMRGGALHDALQVLDVVELQPLHDAEAVAQRRGQKPRAGGGADQRERRQVELDRARRRALADHDVELVILHRRIQHLLDHRRQAMNLVDEQHVAAAAHLAAARYRNGRATAR